MGAILNPGKVRPVQENYEQPIFQEDRELLLSSLASYAKKTGWDIDPDLMARVLERRDVGPVGVGETREPTASQQPPAEESTTPDINTDQPPTGDANTSPHEQQQQQDAEKQKQQQQQQQQEQQRQDAQRQEQQQQPPTTASARQQVAQRQAAQVQNDQRDQEARNSSFAPVEQPQQTNIEPTRNVQQNPLDSEQVQSAIRFDDGSGLKSEREQRLGKFWQFLEKR